MKRFLVFVAIVSLLSGCGEPCEFTFIQMSDTQIAFGEDTVANYPQSTANIYKAVELINNISPELVFNTGDLVNDPSNQLQLDIYKKAVSQIDPSVKYQELIGNHDTRPELFDFDKFSFIHRKCAFIGINSNIIKNNDPREEEQYQWLEGELKNARECSCKYIFIFTHCPIIKKTMDEPEEYFNFPTAKRERYTSLFTKYNVDAVFSGHLHCNTEGKVGDTRYITTGSVAMALGDDISGLRVVKVTEEGFEDRFIPLN